MNAPMLQKLVCRVCV